MATWRLILLGAPLLIDGAGVSSRIPPGQSLVLLSRLALAGRAGCPRGALAASLWPDESTATSGHRLRQAIVKLHKILESASPGAARLVEADRARIWIPRDICVTDVDDFDIAIRSQNWESADLLYAGDLLAGCGDEVIESARERLRQAHRGALRNRIDALEADRDLPRAIETAERLAALEPEDEFAALLVIRLLLAAGRIDTARLRYRKLRRDVLRTSGERLPAATRRQVRDWISAAAIKANQKRSAQIYEIGDTSRNHLAIVRSALAISHDSNDGICHESDDIDAHRLLSEMQRHGILSVDPFLETEPSSTRDASAMRNAGLFSALGRIAAVMKSTEREKLRREHAQAMVLRVRAAANLWQSPNAAAELAGLDRDHREIQAALDHLESANPAEALGLAAGLHWHGYVRGKYAEGRQRLDRLLALTAHDRLTGSDAKARADALLASGHFANCMGDNHIAFGRYREARRVYRQLGDSDGIALTLMREGNAAHETGNYPRGQRLCEIAVRHFRKAGDEPRLLMALFYLRTARFAGDESSFYEPLCDGLYLARSLGDRHYLSLGLYSQAQLLLTTAEVNWRRSAPLLGEALELLARQPNILGTTYTLQALGNLFAARGDVDSAATAFGAASGLRQIHNLCIPYSEIVSPLKQHHPTAFGILRSGIHSNATERGENLAFSLTDVIGFGREELGQ